MGRTVAAVPGPCARRVPAQADNTIIGLGELEAAVARTVDAKREPLVVACDVARFGSDETVIAVRHGDGVRIERSYSGRDPMQTVGHVLDVARKAQKAANWPATVVVDDAGLGGGVTDRLREVGELHVVPFIRGARARQPADYPNRRSEAWFTFADQLPVLGLPDDEQLLADLVSPLTRSTRKAGGSLSRRPTRNVG